jgi:hypothetical protein
MKRGHSTRGQFYVEDLACGDPGWMRVPVDNFVFIYEDGYEVRFTAHGGRTVCSYGRKPRIKDVWFDTYPEALRRMADILEKRGIDNRCL